MAKANKGDWNYISKSYGKVVKAKRPNTKWSLKPPRDTTPKHCVPKWDGEDINVYRDSEGRITEYDPIQVYNYKSAYARYNRGRTIAPEYNDIQTIDSIVYNVYHYPSCDAPSGYWSVYYPANTNGYQSSVKINKTIDYGDGGDGGYDGGEIIWGEYTDGSVDWECNGENEIITWIDKTIYILLYKGQTVCDYNSCNLNGSYNEYSIKVTIGSAEYFYNDNIQLSYQASASGGSCGIEGYSSCNDNQAYCNGSNSAIVNYSGGSYEVLQDNLPVSVDTYQILSYTDNSATNTIRSDNWGMSYAFREEVADSIENEPSGCGGSCPDVENYSANVYIKGQYEQYYQLAYTDTTYPTTVECSDTTECTVSWDDQSVVLQDPNSNYSIITLPIVPYKIVWDTNQEHIINNPDNYSYSTITIFGSKDPCTSCTIYATFTEYGSYTSAVHQSATWAKLPVGNAFAKNTLNGKTTKGSSLIVNCGGVKCSDPFPTEMSIFGSSENTRVQDPCTIVDIKVGGISVIDTIDKTYQLKITDDGVEYLYDITDTNSIEVLTNGGKKIEIEGVQYDIIDENSASKLCVTTYTVAVDNNTIYSNIVPASVKLLCNRTADMQWYLDVSDSQGAIQSIQVTDNNIPVSIQGYIDIMDGTGTTTNTTDSEVYSISCINDDLYCLTITETSGDKEDTICHTSDMTPIVKIEYLPYESLIGEDINTHEQIILARCDDPIITNPTYTLYSSNYIGDNNTNLPIGVDISDIGNDQWIITVYDSNGNVIDEYLVNEKPSIKDDGTITPIEVEVINPELLQCTCPDFTRTSETTIKDGILDVKGNNWQDSQAGSPILLGQRYCKHVSSLLNILGKQTVYKKLLEDYPIELSDIFETENRNSKRTGWIGGQDESDTFNFDKGLSPTINRGNLPKFEDYKP